MARILISPDDAGGWYDELSVVSTYSEGDYETKIKQYSEILFTEYYTIRFKIGVDWGGVTKKPDLALIAKDYSTWWVVEVELSDHRVEHVLDQVEIFKNGNYNATSLHKYIRSVFLDELADVQLDESRLSNLLINTAPQVLVVVDAPTEEWRAELRKSGASLCDLQIFRNTDRSEAYKLGGDYPSIFVDTAPLKYNQKYRNTFEVINADSFSHELNPGSELEISYRGKMGKWAIVKVIGKTYMKCLGKLCPLHFGDEYALRRDQNNNLVILDT